MQFTGDRHLWSGPKPVFAAIVTDRRFGAQARKSIPSGDTYFEALFSKILDFGFLRASFLHNSPLSDLEIAFRLVLCRVVLPEPENNTEV